MVFILGIIVGILLAALTLAADLLFRRVRKEGVVEALQKIAREKGEVIPPKNEELEHFINSLPER